MYLKVLYNDSSNIFALKIVAFYKLAREGNLNESIEKLEELINAIDEREEKNTGLMLHISQLFSRVSGRSMRVLQCTMGLLAKARRLMPLSADLVLEMAQ
jgi:tetratricopeptide repeat protein 21B